MSHNDCIFCKIAKGEIPSATIFENADFKVILDSQEFIDKINNNYDIDITNNVKIWSMTINNFLMNIGCEGINKEQYNEYSDYVFKTFKEFVKNKYNLDIEKTTTFNEVIQ